MPDPSISPRTGWAGSSIVVFLVAYHGLDFESPSDIAQLLQALVSLHNELADALAAGRRNYRRSKR